jgi:hypothetical protein
MKALAIALLLIPSSAMTQARPAIEPPKPIDYALYAAVLTMRGLDFYTTERVLDHGGHELILPAGLVHNRPAFAIFSVGMGALEIVSARMLARRHPKLARAVLAVHIATGAAVVGHNIANF